MARIGKSDRLKTGLYMSKSSGNLIEISKPWLEQFYDKKSKELILLDTALVGTAKNPPIYRAIIGEEAINDLEYIGKL